MTAVTLGATWNAEDRSHIGSDQQTRIAKCGFLWARVPRHHFSLPAPMASTHAALAPRVLSPNAPARRAGARRVDVVSRRAPAICAAASPSTVPEVRAPPKRLPSGSVSTTSAPKPRAVRASIRRWNVRARGSVSPTRATLIPSVPSPASLVFPFQGSKVLVVGATGGVGQLVVAKLLEAGYSVRALARSPEKARDLLGTADALEIVTADLRDAAALDASGVASGVDAVVSCTGTTAFPPRVGRTATAPRTPTSSARETSSRRSKPPPRVRAFRPRLIYRRRAHGPDALPHPQPVRRAQVQGHGRGCGARQRVAVHHPSTGSAHRRTVHVVRRQHAAPRDERDASIRGSEGGGHAPPGGDQPHRRRGRRRRCAHAASTVSGEYCVGTKEGEGPGSDAGKWDALFEAANANE